MSYFKRSTTFLTMLSLILMLTYATNAQTMAPSPASSVSSDCVTALFNLTDCLTYVTTGSNATKPDKACCPELAGLIESNPVCLCEMLAGAGESYGISVDNERALALPKICHISTPPVSTCAVLGFPVSMGPAPASAEVSSPSGQPQLPAGKDSAPVGSAEGKSTSNDSVKSIVSIASSFILAIIAISGIF